MKIQYLSRKCNHSGPTRECEIVNSFSALSEVTRPPGLSARGSAMRTAVASDLRLLPGARSGHSPSVAAAAGAWCPRPARRAKPGFGSSRHRPASGERSGRQALFPEPEQDSCSLHCCLNTTAAATTSSKNRTLPGVSSLPRLTKIWRRKILSTWGKYLSKTELCCCHLGF